MPATGEGLLESILVKFSFDCAVEGILNLPEATESIVIGTAYKEMKLKPNILDEYVKVRTRWRFSFISVCQTS